MKKTLISVCCLLLAGILVLPMFSVYAEGSAGSQDIQYRVYEQTPGVAKTGALDYSWMNHAPAGKHGAVIANGDNLTFEDGTPIKFFGVNLGFGAATPSKEEAEGMAAELASSGVNFARIHVLDATYNGILSYAGGTTVISESALDKMDYLIHCLKEKGIYIHLDTNACRILQEGDGFTAEEVAASRQLGDMLRGMMYLDDKVVTLLQQFVRDLMTHVNPYTGMRYADDPAIAVVQYANESCATYFDWSVTEDNILVRRVIDKYNDWLLAKYKTRDNLKKAWTNDKGECALQADEDPAKKTVKGSGFGAGHGDPAVDYRTAFDHLNCSPRHADFISFLMDEQTKTFTAFYDMLRELGYKGLINCSNLPWGHPNAYLNSLGDIMEGNAYWNNGTSYAIPSNFHSSVQMCTMPRNATDHPVGSLARASVSGKPMMVTEWNVGMPNKFSADALFQMAAYGAHQGWDGFCIFNYTFNFGFSGGVLVNQGYTDFYTFNISPARYAQFGLAAMIFRLGIVSEAKNSVEIGITRDDLLAQNTGYSTAPYYTAFVSKVSYKFIDEDGVYDGDADLVIPSGNTASGDYTAAQHLLMRTDNLYGDAYNKNPNANAWYAMHTQPNSEKTQIWDKTFNIGTTAAVSTDQTKFDGTFFSGKPVYREVLTEVMRKFGLISENEGYFTDKVVTDTGEITYTYKDSFRLETARAAVYAGRSKNGTDGQVFAGCRLITDNDLACVAVVSLDGDKAITGAERLTVYAMGRESSTGIEWSGDTLTNLGTGPMLVEDIVGTLEIPTRATKCTVYALDSMGARVSEVKTTAIEGGFAMALGSAIQYEVLLSDFVEETQPPETETPTEPATDPVTEPATDPITEPTTDPANRPATESPTPTESETETQATGCASTVAPYGMVALLCVPAVTAYGGRRRKARREQR